MITTPSRHSAKGSPFVTAVAYCSPEIEPRPLRVLLAYDDVPAGHRALQTLTQRLGNDGATLPAQPSFWSFEGLQDPRLQAAALAEAASADLVICSASQAAHIPAAVDRLISAMLGSLEPPHEIMALFGAEEVWTISCGGGARPDATAA